MLAREGQIPFFFIFLFQDAVLKCDPKFNAEGLDDICRSWFTSQYPYN